MLEESGYRLPKIQSLGRNQNENNGLNNQASKLLPPISGNGSNHGSSILKNQLPPYYN